MASIRSQAIANFLSKTIPQYYFTTQDVYTQEPTIRVRNRTHRVVQAPDEERDERVHRRLVPCPSSRLISVENVTTDDLYTSLFL